MPRHTLLTVMATAIVTVVLIPGAQAQNHRPPATPAYYAQPKKVVIDPNPLSGTPQAMQTDGAPVVHVQQQAGYVYLNAPLYPVPRPNIPHQVGSTMITNQALAPHEMLYPHTYRALYPPYYYRVKGKWIGTPFHSHAYDRWELQGTEVEIEYSSRLPFLSRFSNPFSFLHH